MSHVFSSGKSLSRKREQTIFGTFWGFLSISLLLFNFVGCNVKRIFVFNVYKLMKTLNIIILDIALVHWTEWSPFYSFIFRRPVNWRNFIFIMGNISMNFSFFLSFWNGQFWSGVAYNDDSHQENRLHCSVNSFTIESLRIYGAQHPFRQCFQ